MIELSAAIIANRWLADTSVLDHINPVRFRPRLEERYVAHRPRHRGGPVDDTPQRVAALRECAGWPEVWGQTHGQPPPGSPTTSAGSRTSRCR